MPNRFGVSHPSSYDDNVPMPDSLATQRQLLSDALIAPTSAPMRFVQGIKDPFDAWARLVTHALPNSVVDAGNQANNWLADKTGLVGRIPAGGLDQAIAEQEKQYQAARDFAGQQGTDWAREAGSYASPANLALAKSYLTIASKLPMAAPLIRRLFAFGANAPKAPTDPLPQTVIDPSSFTP